MNILRQALQDEQSGQRRATDAPRPAYRQGLPEHESSSSSAGCREQSGISALARERRWMRFTRLASMLLRYSMQRMAAEHVYALLLDTFGHNVTSPRR
jgi:hypothetical protein